MKKDLSLEAAKAILGTEVDSSDLGSNVKNILNNSFEGKSVRTFGFKSEVCFIGKDVAELLGYKNSNETISKHCRKPISLGDISKGSEMLPLKEALNLGNSWKQTKIIRQGDVLRLIVKSKLPNAEKIESWIFDEVIPKVLDKGEYSINESKLKEKIAQLKKANDVLVAHYSQRIPIEKFDEIEKGDFFFHARASTLVKKSSLKQTFAEIERPMREELENLELWAKNEVGKNKAEVTKEWQTIKSSLNSSIWDCKNTIKLLGRYTAAAEILEKRESMLKSWRIEMKQLEQLKIDNHKFLVDKLHNLNENIHARQKAIAYEIETRHAPLIQKRKAAAIARLKEEKAKLRDYKNGTITLTELAEWSKVNFDVFAITHEPKELEI